MENFERQMADHADKENRAQHGKLEKTGGVNAKLAAGLKKLSHEHLASLHHAVAGEMERRAKEHTKNKPPGQMSEKEFQQFARHHMGQD
jgi:hypothetical protein